MGKADLHIHTAYSFDSSCTVPAVLDWAVSSAGLDVIAITDHDAFDGALEAVRRGPEFGIQVIPGMEVSTSDGHLLALDLQEPVLPGRSMHETILKVGEQGGFCIAAHPTAILAHGVKRETLIAILRDPDTHPVLLGLETLNSGIFFQMTNRAAQQINEELRLAPTGGSDSHVVWTVGIGFTEFPGRSAADLRRALLERKTTPRRVSKRWPSYWPGHVYNRTLRKMGWATWTPQPNGSYVRRRLSDVQAG
jgi:predicted metal-dependent phosphoesterase TrpH